MKKRIFFAALALMISSSIYAQCSSAYSYSATFASVTFTNHSTISNAHYFWNFGDGTGSNVTHALHQYPESGNYLVTLFALDTVTNCSAFYEQWIQVNAYSADSCQPTIRDSIFQYNGDEFLFVLDSAPNCGGYSNNVDAGPGQNYPDQTWIFIGADWNHARWVSRKQYFTYNTLSGFVFHRTAYKTTPYHYSSAKNYGACSANFEFEVISQDQNGQRILFTAMNQNATNYTWEILGFGNPIISTQDTVSHYYPYNPHITWMVGLRTVGATGCMDTLYQQILVSKDANTVLAKPDQAITVPGRVYPNPFNHEVQFEFPDLREKADLVIYNALGQPVRTIQGLTGAQTTVDCADLPSGSYFYLLRGQRGVLSTGKLVAE